MKQLSLFNHGLNTCDKDLSIFKDDIKIQDEYTNEPYLKKCTSLLKLLPASYVRLKNGATYRIEGLDKEQTVYEGFEVKTTREGRKYKKDIFTLRERGFCTIFDYTTGKDTKKIIRQEDVAAQSSFLIDLIFKGDYVETKTYGTLLVEHKHVGKTIEFQDFVTTKTGEIKKVKKKATKTYLLCDNARIVLYESDLIGISDSPLFDYAQYLEEGMEIKCDYWGWVTVQKVMNKKVWCLCERINKNVFVWFNEIVDIKEE